MGAVADWFLLPACPGVGFEGWGVALHINLEGKFSTTTGRTGLTKLLGRPFTNQLEKEGVHTATENAGHVIYSLSGFYPVGRGDSPQMLQLFVTAPHDYSITILLGGASLS